MRFEHDTKADAVYIYMHDTIAPGEAVKQIELSSLKAAGQLLVDLDRENRIIGFEILGASQLLDVDRLTAE